MSAAWNATAEQPLFVVESPAAPLRMEVVDDAAGFAALRDEWNQLLATTGADCLFLTWEPLVERPEHSAAIRAWRQDFLTPATSSKSGLLIAVDPAREAALERVTDIAHS